MDRPKSGRKAIGRRSKNGPKNGPRDQRSARTAGHNLGPAEWVLEVDPAECAEPGEDYRRGSGKDFGRTPVEGSHTPCARRAGGPLRAFRQAVMRK